MATRFYLRSDVGNTSDVQPSWHSSWTKVGTGVALICSTGVSNSNFAFCSNTALAGGGAELIGLRQWVSDPIIAQTVSGTLNGVIGCRENAAQLNATIAITAFICDSGGNIREQLCTGQASDNTATTPPEITSSSTDEFTRQFQSPTEEIFIKLTGVNALDEDRIVIQIGFREVNTNTSRFVVAEIGDNSTDHLFNSGVTTQLNPWIEFSQNIIFQVTGGGPQTIQKDYDFPIFTYFSKNSINLIDTSAQTRFSLNKLNLDLKNQLFNGNYDFRKNINVLIGDTYNLDILDSQNTNFFKNKVFSIEDIISPNLIANKNANFNLDISTSKNTISTINHNYQIYFDALKDIQLPAGEIFEKDYTFLLGVSLIKNMIMSTDKNLVLDFDFNKNKISLVNSKFNISNVSSKNSIGKINSDLDIILNTADNLKGLSNKYFNINVNYRKGLLALINSSLDTGFGSSYDQADSGTLLDGFFGFQFGLHKNINIIKNIIYDIRLEKIKNLIGIIDSKFLNQILEYSNIIGQQNTSFNLNLDIFKNLNNLTNQIFPISFRISQDLAEILLKEYTFPLLIDLGYDTTIAVPSIIVDIESDGIDRDFWCIIKRINTSIISDPIVNWVRSKKA